MALSMTESVQLRLGALPPDDNWGVSAAQLLLEAADSCGASDLHLLPQRDGALARVRRDDELMHLAQIPAARRELLTARLKVLARLPAFVKTEPQDGRIEWRLPGAQSVRTLRISFLPTLHGEHVVVRFPENSGNALGLEELGLSPSAMLAMNGLLEAHEGVVLVTGPAGSGKTTTLYALLSTLRDRDGARRNFLTIEDPIERDLGFAAQVPVHDAQGMTWERALRAAMRQDPDVLMVGEIRDVETARLTVQAGTSGHLVLSTLHAGRAARVFTRLLSMGVDAYLAASALQGAVAQRLVRLTCRECAGSGCAACGESGYHGRRGIFEVCRVTEPLRELMLARALPAVIAMEAARFSATTLETELRELVETGAITNAEARFALGGEGDVS